MRYLKTMLWNVSVRLKRETPIREAYGDLGCHAAAEQSVGE